MPISFVSSSLGTLGVEWEFALIDTLSLTLQPRADEILQELGEGPPGPFRREFMAHMVEIVTGVHTAVPDAVAELHQHYARLHAAAQSRGLALLAVGTHPCAVSTRQQTTCDPRYAQISNTGRYWADRLTICGTHVHVGVDNVAKVMPVIAGMSVFIPHLLALSGSSPFWEGEDTGYASQRAMLFQQLPSAGLPPKLADWDEYQHYLDDATALSMAEKPNDLRWDLRPSPGLGTIENRVLDGMPTLGEVGALTAFTQCLVIWLSQLWESGTDVATLAPWFVRENKWRAARYGLDTSIIWPDGTSLKEIGLADSISHMVEVLEPIGRRLGCVQELQFIHMLSKLGPSYARQREVFTRTGSLTHVVAALMAETAAGLPHWRAA